MTMPTTTPVDVPLFGAEDLRRIQRINEEIDRNARASRAPDLPMFPDDDPPLVISYGSTPIHNTRRTTDED